MKGRKDIVIDYDRYEQEQREHLLTVGRTKRRSFNRGYEVGSKAALAVVKNIVTLFHELDDAQVDDLIKCSLENVVDQEECKKIIKLFVGQA